MVKTTIMKEKRAEEYADPATYVFNRENPA